MVEPTILDPSGDPSPPTGHERSVRLRKNALDWLKNFRKPEHFLALLALLVIGGQLGLMFKQSAIMDRQTQVMKQQFHLAEVQQELATRPTVELIQGDLANKTPWKFTNDGPYKIKNISLRSLHFKKFSGLGWHDTVSSVGLFNETLVAGKSLDIPFANWLKVQTFDMPGYAPVEGADFVIMEIQFRREIDDKVYLYLQPVELIGDMIWIVKPMMASNSGPLQKSCTPESFSVELMYEFYRRNPMPYPVELYNFHYLLGNDPATNCLKSFRTMQP